MDDIIETLREAKENFPNSNVMQIINHALDLKYGKNPKSRELRAHKYLTDTVINSAVANLNRSFKRAKQPQQ